MNRDTIGLCASLGQPADFVHDHGGSSDNATSCLGAVSAERKVSAANHNNRDSPKEQ